MTEIELECIKAEQRVWKLINTAEIIPQPGVNTTAETLKDDLSCMIGLFRRAAAFARDTRDRGRVTGKGECADNSPMVIKSDGRFEIRLLNRRVSMKNTETGYELRLSSLLPLKTAPRRVGGRGVAVVQKRCAQRVYIKLTHEAMAAVVALYKAHTGKEEKT